MYRIRLRRKYRISIRTFSKAALLAIFIVFSTREYALAEIYDLGRHGNVYEVVEPDFLDVIEARARALEKDSEAIKRRMRERAEAYRPRNAVDLPPAKKNGVRLVDMTYTLEFDITDGKGNVVYPKGFQFNPLEYVPFNETLVILNGTREREIRWFLSSRYANEPGVKVLLTEGRWMEVKKSLGRHVYYLTDFMAGRLHIEATPSVVRAKSNKYMEVMEFKVEKDGEVAE